MKRIAVSFPKCFIERRRCLCLLVLGTCLFLSTFNSIISVHRSVRRLRVHYLLDLEEQRSWIYQWILNNNLSKVEQKVKTGRRNAFQLLKNTAMQAGIMELSQIKQFCKRETWHIGCDDLTYGALLQLRSKMDLLSKRIRLVQSLGQESRKYTYAITRIMAFQDEHGRAAVRLRIEEKYKRRYSQGGANFKILVLSANVKAVCPIEDHFNGTYTANCSLPNQCSTINVTLMFTNFSAYWRQDPDPLNKSLFVRRVCLNDRATSEEKLPKENYCKPEDVKLNETHLVYWLRSVKRNYSRSVWQLGSKGCVVRHVLGSHVRNFVNHYQRVVFIGDSHTRYYFYYFLYLLNKMPINIIRKLETELHIDKLSFLLSPYEKDLISHLNSFAKGHVLRQASSESPNLVMISVGAWTLQEGSFADYILRLRETFKALRTFRKTAVGQHTNLVWLTSPPARESGRPSNQHDNRNTYATSAANAWATTHLRRIGVDVFDVTPIAYPRMDAHVCSGHLLCLENGKGTPYNLGVHFIEPYVHGLTGRAAMDYLLQALSGASIL